MEIIFIFFKLYHNGSSNVKPLKLIDENVDQRKFNLFRDIFRI